MKKNTLCLLLRLLKEEFGMRDAAVARECGMNKTAVCRIGQGYDLKKSGHDDAFRRLAECLYGRACRCGDVEKFLRIKNCLFEIMCMELNLKTDVLEG